MSLVNLGLVSGVLIVIADIPYALNAWKHKTHPHRTTWFIIFLINSINLANQGASGAKNSLLFFVGAVIITFIVFLVSLLRGVGGLAKLDIFVLTAAAIGLFLWWLLDSPLASIIINVFISAFAMLPTFTKAYHRPKSETKITWLIGAISTALAAISVGKLDFALLVIPLYATIQQGCLFMLIEVRERQLS
jgi:hypothetical protein